MMRMTKDLFVPTRSELFLRRRSTKDIKPPRFLIIYAMAVVLLILKRTS